MANIWNFLTKVLNFVHNIDVLNDLFTSDKYF